MESFISRCIRFICPDSSDASIMEIKVSHLMKLLSSLGSFVVGVVGIWLLTWPCSVRAEPINQPDLCALEESQLDAKLELMTQIVNATRANPIRVDELKQKLHDLLAQQLGSRISFFDGHVTRLERPDVTATRPNAKVTGTFVEGQKEFSSFQGSLMRFDNDIFTYALLLLIKCPNPQPNIIFRTFVTDAALQANYPMIGDHKPLAPTTELSRLHAKLAALNVGDPVTISGTIQLFLYAIQDNSIYSFLNGPEQFPPESPEAGGTSEMPPGGNPTADYRVIAPGDASSVVYDVQITDIQKR